MGTTLLEIVRNRFATAYVVINGQSVDITSKTNILELAEKVGYTVVGESFFGKNPEYPNVAVYFECDTHRLSLVGRGGICLFDVLPLDTIRDRFTVQSMATIFGVMEKVLNSPNDFFDIVRDEVHCWVKEFHLSGNYRDKAVIAGVRESTDDEKRFTGFDDYEDMFHLVAFGDQECAICHDTNVLTLLDKAAFRCIGPIFDSQVYVSKRMITPDATIRIEHHYSNNAWLKITVRKGQDTRAIMTVGDLETLGKSGYFVSRKGHLGTLTVCGFGTMLEAMYECTTTTRDPFEIFQETFSELQWQEIAPVA